MEFTSSASPSAKRKTTRQLARTVTAQKPFNSPFERMQPESRQVHIPYGTSSVQPRKDITQFRDVIYEHTTRVVILIKPL